MNDPNLTTVFRHIFCTNMYYNRVVSTHEWLGENSGKMKKDIHMIFCTNLHKKSFTISASTPMYQ